MIVQLQGSEPGLRDARTSTTTSRGQEWRLQIQILSSGIYASKALKTLKNK